MSHPSASFYPDYDHQPQWRDSLVHQRRPSHPSPQFCGDNSHFGAVYYNSGVKACPKSMISYEGGLPWAPEQYNTVCSPGQIAYAEDDEPHIQHATHEDDAEYQHVGQHGHYVYDSSPDVSENYSHQGEMVDSPIDESQYYPANEHQSDQHPSYSAEWAQEGRMSSQGSTEVPDEYRALIARYSDEVHASGLHGLESDNDAVHIYGFGGHHSSWEEQEEENPLVHQQPIRYQPQDEWDSKVATDAFNSLVGHIQHNGHVPTMAYVNSESLPESPVTVPSQQHIVDLLHGQERVSRSRSPETHYQLAPAPLMNHLTPPPLVETPRLLFATPPKYPLVQHTSPILSPRQGLEHQTAAAGSPSHQEEEQPILPASAFPGSSQSVLKLTSTKKVSEKKQALACLFCRERKIACGRPDPESEDQTCNQCARRRISCEYPKESRRGQHKRTRRKATHDHDVNRSSPLSVN